MDSTAGAGSTRPHFAARLEDRILGVNSRLLRRRGWHPLVVPYLGYGSTRLVRILGRVMLAPPESIRRTAREAPGLPARGWRRFLTAQVPHYEVELEIAGSVRTLRTDRGGYLDEVVDAALQPGWHDLSVRCPDRPPKPLRVRIVRDEPGIGLVSDIDDTVMVTLLPRPLIAAWNTLVLRESARQVVPGMPGLYQRILRRHPEALVIYLSTGAWNVAGALTRFLDRHGYPDGPLLLTDWGPTNYGWFRSGRAHKDAALRRLADELPQVRWILVGDDGQHDPQIYADFAAEQPDHVAAIAIRQLTPTQRVLSHGTPLPATAEEEPAVVTVHAPDGTRLAAELAERTDLI